MKKSTLQFIIVCLVLILILYIGSDVIIKTSDEHIIDSSEFMERSRMPREMNKINKSNTKTNIKTNMPTKYNVSTYAWNQCVKNNESNDNTLQAMHKLLNMVQNEEIVFYVIATYKRRPRFFNLANCSFPFNLFLICPNFYYFNGYSYARKDEENCTFGKLCQFYNSIYFYKYIYEINKPTKWVLVFEDDVNFCPGTPQYILDVMNLSLSKNINSVHLSRGNAGTMIKTSFIPKFIELLSQVNAMRKRTRSGCGAGVDVCLTKLFYEKKNHFDIYYSKHNMMHHPRVSLSIKAQQHQYDGGLNQATCDKIGHRYAAKQLNYINPYNMQITFEHLN